MSILTKGILKMEMDNIEEADMKKLEEYFIELINVQIHRYRNGKMILHFDNTGLQKIEIDKLVWKRSRY